MPYSKPNVLRHINLTGRICHKHYYYHCELTLDCHRRRARRALAPNPFLPTISTLNATIFQNFFLISTALIKKLVYLQSDCGQVNQFGCQNPSCRQASIPCLSSRRAFSGAQSPRQGDGWVTRHDIMKAFTWRSVLDTSNLAKFQMSCHELGNGRCPGCDYISTM